MTPTALYEEEITSGKAPKFYKRMQELIDTGRVRRHGNEYSKTI